MSWQPTLISRSATVPGFHLCFFLAGAAATGLPRCCLTAIGFCIFFLFEFSFTAVAFTRAMTLAGQRSVQRCLQRGLVRSGGV